MHLKIAYEPEGEQATYLEEDSLFEEIDGAVAAMWVHIRHRERAAGKRLAVLQEYKITFLDGAGDVALRLPVTVFDTTKYMLALNVGDYITTPPELVREGSRPESIVQDIRYGVENMWIEIVEITAWGKPSVADRARWRIPLARLPELEIAERTEA